MNKQKFLELNNYGKLSLLSAVIALLPVIVLPFYPEEFKYGIHFVISAGIALAVGIIFCLTGKPYDQGMAVTPLNLEDFYMEADLPLTVAQMVEPIIIENGSVRRVGSVLLREEGI